LSKGFFAWEKEPVLQKAASDPASLRDEEHAFCFSIYALATLSLTEEECQNIVGKPRNSSLSTFQSTTEAALRSAHYISTRSLLVLQALTLYMVGS
jgi:hypothetical protein